MKGHVGGHHRPGHVRYALLKCIVKLSVRLVLSVLLAPVHGAKA